MAQGISTKSARQNAVLMAILGFSLVGSDANAKGTGTKDDPFIFEDGGSYSLDDLIGRFGKNYVVSRPTREKPFAPS